MVDSASSGEWNYVAEKVTYAKAYGFLHVLRLSMSLVKEFAVSAIPGNVVRSLHLPSPDGVDDSDSMQMVDDGDLVDLDVGEKAEAAALLEARPCTYRAADEALKTELKDMLAAGDLQNDPKKVLGFVARNTNPHWLAFSWNNLVDALKECYEKVSLSPLVHIVFSQNCVHCTRAIDQTLARMLAFSQGKADALDLIQVDQGKPDEFYRIHGAMHSKGLAVKDEAGVHFLAHLQAAVQPGQRACIAVPVKAVGGKFSHAMNIVNLGPAPNKAGDRCFILCGQTGRVYDLADPSDVSRFCDRYDSPDSEAQSVKYALPSQEADHCLSLQDLLMHGDQTAQEAPAEVGAERPPSHALLA